MRTKLLIGAIAFGLVITDPAICAQTAPTSPEASQLVLGEVGDPLNPEPMQDPSDPMPPATEPLPPEMPMPAGEGQQMPPAPPEPVSPPATPPTSGSDTATSGSTTTATLTPQPATKEYPPCTKMLQDNCRNPGEGPKATKKPR